MSMLPEKLFKIVGVSPKWGNVPIKREKKDPKEEGHDSPTLGNNVPKEEQDK